jgi:hypothetical protein
LVGQNNRLGGSLLFITVPTLGSHPEMLEALAQSSGVPPERIVIVATGPNVKVPAGTVVVEDFGPLNIQRWWNRGIDEAISRGATAVAVLNDDVRVGPEALRQLHEALLESDAAVASPTRPGEPAKLNRGRLIPYSPKIWGCLWVLNVSSGLRPDERYEWWYGDHDLDIRGRRDFPGIVTVEVDYEHVHSGEATSSSSKFAEIIRRDEMTYQSDYARLQTLDRWAKKLLRF